MRLPEGFQFEKEFEVGAFQVHPNGNIRLSSLVDFFQEIAWQHADSQGFGRILLEAQQMWVLSRLELRVSHFPTWGQKIRIFTGGRGAASAFAFREFLVYDEQQVPIARAMSSWLLVHAGTKRILKPQGVLPPALFDPSQSPSWQPEKLYPSGPVLGERLLQVAYSDLDIYHHVNHTAYIRWVENLVAEKDLFPKSIAINYLAECKAGDEVTLTLQGETTATFVVGTVAGKLVVVAKI